MKPHVQILGAAALLSMTAAMLPVDASEREIYRRASILDMRSGVMEVREVIAPLADVPVIGRGGASTETTAQRFARAYRVAFLEELRSADEAGERRALRTPLGEIHLALAFEREDEELYDDELRDALSSLSAEAFAEPLAGLDQRTPPFDASTVAARTQEPSWACFETAETTRATRYTRTVTPHRDGGEPTVATGSAGYSDEEITAPLCDGLRNLTEPSRPVVIRTAPTPLSLLETTVRVAEAGGIPGRLTRDELASLPDEAVMLRRRNPGTKRAIHRGERGSLTSGSFTLEGETLITALKPANLRPQLLDGPAWLARFGVEVSERAHGPAPSDTPLETWDIHVALLPVGPPTEVEADFELEFDEEGRAVGVKRPASELSPDEEANVQFDSDAFVEKVAERLADERSLTTGALESALTQQPGGLASRGWLMIVCRDDGTATYGVPPAPSRNVVTNPGELCDVLRRLCE